VLKFHPQRLGPIVMIVDNENSEWLALLHSVRSYCDNLVPVEIIRQLPGMRGRPILLQRDRFFLPVDPAIAPVQKPTI
jgi:hypothetical protein